ncbi:MAG: pilus assembly protein N-terminal domain-containing protein [Alphaproteobacteria bacterium]
MRNIPARIGAVVALAATLISGGALAKGGIAVASDHVKIVEFPEPIVTVYVGNPSIADVTMIDTMHVFLIGKNYGTTNIVALDAKGNEIFNRTVTVFGGPTLVSVHHGLARTTVSCTASRCEATPMPGDAKPPFEEITDEMNKRVAQAKAATLPESPDQ